MPNRQRLAALAGGALIAIAACAPSATPSVAPSASSSSVAAAPSGAPSPAAVATPAIPGLSWVKAAVVARPDDAFAQPSADPSGPSGPGTAGHPGHFPGQAIVDDVVATGDGLTAVGYVGIDGGWTAIAWTSRDGEAWTL